MNKNSPKALLLFDANRATLSDFLLKEKSSWGSTEKYAEYSVELTGRKFKLPYLSGGILKRP